MLSRSASQLRRPSTASGLMSVRHKHRGHARRNGCWEESAPLAGRQQRQDGMPCDCPDMRRLAPAPPCGRSEPVGRHVSVQANAKTQQILNQAGAAAGAIAQQAGQQVRARGRVLGSRGCRHCHAIGSRQLLAGQPDGASCSSKHSRWSCLDVCPPPSQRVAQSCQQGSRASQLRLAVVSLAPYLRATSAAVHPVVPLPVPLAQVAAVQQAGQNAAAGIAAGLGQALGAASGQFGLPQPLLLQG